MPSQYVFYPIDVTESGYVLGWRNTSTIVVAGVLPLKSLDLAEAALTRLSVLTSKRNLPFPSLELLGVHWSRGESSASQVIWQDQTLSSDQMLVICYKRPKHGSMRHYSLVSLKLDSSLTIPDCKTSACLASKHGFSLISQACFVEKRNCPIQGIDLGIVTQMNTAHRVMELLKSTMGPSLLDSTGNLTSAAGKKHIIPAVKRLCRLSRDLLHFFRCHFLHLHGFESWMQSFIVSAQQLDLRCEQLIFVLRQAWLLDRPEGTSSNETSGHYISTQNCIWLILNDIIIGSAVGVFLVDNRGSLARKVQDIVMHCTVASIRTSIFWLDNWPAGLKLNTELSRFLFLIFSSLINVSEVALNAVGSLLPTIILIIGTSGIFGMTMILALLSDLMSVLTVHLSVSYTIVRLAFRTQLLMANSLFNLFRGKRYNVLRQRLDDWDYDLDQLLLGAMLLTLTNFLFPTITVYYVLFALSRFMILMLEAGFEVALALLNHFPLFALTLRIKDPWRLPGGIVLHPYKHAQTGQRSFVIRNAPVALSKIFGQYYALGSKLTAHYSPRRIIIDFVKGNRLDPIPHRSIRYTYDIHDQ